MPPSSVSSSSPLSLGTSRLSSSIFLPITSTQRRPVLALLKLPVLVFLDDDLGANAANSVGVLVVLVEDAIVAVALKLLACATMAGSRLRRLLGWGEVQVRTYVAGDRGPELMVVSWLLSKHPCVVEYGERGEIYIDVRVE
jgi:hypothetical protein